jgi:catechol 2,3-dioxygenase
MLVEQPGARPVQAGRTGLYHFAILTPSRYELSRVLNHLVDSRTPIGGASDHAVSEALYLTDPDGHGIEIYRDRPRDEWPEMNGRINMTLDPFDAQGVLAELAKNPAEWEGLHPDTKIGHVHLHVADIAAAEKFYVETLGFDLVLRYGGSASFISAGGYHHHLGLNVWAGQGAPPPPDDACRLLYYVIDVPDQAALDSVKQRLQSAAIAYDETEAGLRVSDPFRNMIHINVHG